MGAIKIVFENNLEPKKLFVNRDDVKEILNNIWLIKIHQFKNLGLI